MNLLNLLTNTQSVLAYIDPAATSVLLSSIVAIVVAIGASAIVIWRKVKKGVSKTFHIDPNANKEVEEDVVLTDESAEEVTEEVETVEETAKEETSEKPKKSTKSKKTSK